MTQGQEADKLLVAEVLSRINHGVPDDYQWAVMMHDIEVDLEERTRPAEIEREQYLPEFADKVATGAWNVFAPGPISNWDPEFGGVQPLIVYRPR
jgi:hypothetical protein